VDIAQRGREVLLALKTRDGARLASQVHPVDGVRFSPYAHVRVDNDVVLSRDRVATMFTDTTKRMWGHADGSGEPLLWPFDRYYGKYVYDVDFSAAPVVRINQGPIKSGNTPGNLRDAYPTAQWVEYHFPALDPKFDGMDWRSLWLVFASRGGEWFLVGVVHGSWTI
jgi:hypothetical protein